MDAVTLENIAFLFACGSALMLVVVLCKLARVVRADKRAEAQATWAEGE